MPSQTLPASRAIFQRNREVVPDAGVVLSVLIRPGKAHCRKALLVNRLRELRATLDQDGAERNNVNSRAQDRLGPRNQNHVDPPDQDHRVERDEDHRST